jgi:serine/threonine protein kinase
MIGEQFGNFRILDKLGEGGMGVVYKAIDIHLDRPVAIKMLNTDLARNPELVERFRSEAKAQANLNHVNLATLYAFLVEKGNAFMVMEFVEGETLDQMIRNRGPLPPEDAVPWFKQALLGIGSAHRMGIIHRDIKPSNIMRNSRGIVKVMDFGIAKVVGMRGLTRTGMLLGTPAYMSPEQIQNRHVDVRSDIYALGITLYQMLTGRLPFDTDNDFELMNSQVTLVPPPLKRMHPYAPDQYQGIVMKALAKNPDDRYQTVEEFGAALEHPEHALSTAGPAQPSPAMRPTVMETPGSSFSAGLAPAAAVAPSALSASASAPLAPTRVATTSQQPAPSSAVAASQTSAIRPASGKFIWNSRYTLATGIAAGAAVLFAVLLLARKPPVAQVSAVNNSPSSAVNSRLLQSQVEVTTGDPGALLDPGPAPNRSGRVGTDAVSPGHSAVVAPVAPPSAPARGGKKTASNRQLDTPKQDSGAQPGSMPQAEIDALEHRIDQLSSRATAVNNSLNHFQQQQATAGYGLRGDMVSAQASMQTNLSKAQSAMERGEYAKATKYADIAAADLETLEHFLGR